MDLKSKLSIVPGTIANAKKDIESFKTEINNFKSEHAMSKKGLNYFNNEFNDYFINSLKINDNLVKIDSDILMTKNEYYVNIRNKGHIINNDMLVNKNKCIKLKSVVRENINSLKNIKNNLYNVKKDTNSLSIDLKKLKEEHINKSNKRVKARSIFINITANRFNKRFDRFNMMFNRFVNKSSSKTNACTIKDSAIVKNHVDACTNTDDLVKNHVNACTSTDDLIAKNHVNACPTTDYLVKNDVDACTNTDDVTTNDNEPCTNENEPCTSDDNNDDNSDDYSNDKAGNNDNKPGNSGNNDNKPGNSSNKDNNDNKPGKNYNKDNTDNKQGNKDNYNKLVNNDNKESHQISLRELFSNNLTKIIGLVDELKNDEIYDDDQWLVFAQLNKINPLLDELTDRVWLIIYNKNREKNELINIGVDKDKDIEGYVNIYNKIVDDKLEFVNRISELFNNAIEKKKFNNLKDDALKLISNSCICDVERKGCKKDNNKEKDSDDSKNVNNNIMIK